MNPDFFTWPLSSSPYQNLLLDSAHRRLWRQDRLITPVSQVTGFMCYENHTAAYFHSYHPFPKAFTANISSSKQMDIGHFNAHNCPVMYQKFLFINQKIKIDIDYYKRCCWFPIPHPQTHHWVHLKLTTSHSRYFSIHRQGSLKVPGAILKQWEKRISG